jgi:RNA polymerase sigma-70 factor (ECF subfamily)
VTDQNVYLYRGAKLTSASLLLRIKERDPAAWERFVLLYTPLVYHWCRRAGLPEEDAADVGQEVFAAVARLIPEFRYRQVGGTFRGWLWTITRNKISDFLRREQTQPQRVGGNAALKQLAQLPAEEGGVRSSDEAANEEQFLCWRAAELVRRGVEEKTWAAFWRVTVEGEWPADVAADLGMSVNAVYLARVRLLARLREEFAGLIDFTGVGPAPPPTPEACDDTG